MSKEKPEAGNTTADSQSSNSMHSNKELLDNKVLNKENLNGAAIIDNKGREVPITESMIVDAFNQIEKSDKAQ
ncbi:MAG: hypothetical protein P8H31_00240 [Porticoccaceae bacterium]|nr:hypothetical protein [Porticoccaceae bacterium]